jgi:hypothetical protein
MLIVLFGLMTVAAFVASYRLQLPQGGAAPKLGWMSEQWLAEYRASQVSEAG